MLPLLRLLQLEMLLLLLLTTLLLTLLLLLLLLLFLLVRTSPSSGHPWIQGWSGPS